MGDLDGDGELCIVAGSRDEEDYEVISWQKDDTPFTALWSQDDVGAMTLGVDSVSIVRTAERGGR